MSFGTSKEKSTTGTKAQPGLFGHPSKKRPLFDFGADIGRQIQALIGETSEFQDPFQQAILAPEFGASTASETALLESLASLTQGAGAIRGLGPATPASLSQTLAPALIGFRQQEIGNLQGGLQSDRGQQQLILQTLLQLAGLAKPSFGAQGVSRGESLDVDTGIKTTIPLGPGGP